MRSWKPSRASGRAITERTSRRDSCFPKPNPFGALVSCMYSASRYSYSIGFFSQAFTLGQVNDLACALSFAYRKPDLTPRTLRGALRHTFGL